ncbi:HU family DNA-binding protein [Pyramidobacter piscolens]|uniref:HU family DNA-binding protein n=1 Tax=Pyramidobacter piscolens TaxID=638849 RepID=UPI00244651EF|nr:HU family DNA-binding protein [Pyramidobacter piscolens]
MDNLRRQRKMTKNDLINEVAANAGMSKKAAGEAISATFAAIEKALAKGDRVQLVGFGTFEVRKRAARVGRNPQDPKKTIQIPAKQVPVFRAGKGLKEQVN